MAFVQKVQNLRVLDQDIENLLYLLFLSSSYNHSGNFKQHLLKHERESGSISAMIIAKANGDTDIMNLLEVPAKVHRPSGANKISRPDMNKKTYTCDHCGRKSHFFIIFFFAFTGIQSFFPWRR